MGLRKGQTNKGSFKKGEHRNPSTEIKKGQRLSPKTEFKKGKSPYNKGKKGLQGSNKGSFKKGITPWNKGKQLPTTPLRRAIRDCFKMRSWINSCYIRDDFTCGQCNEHGGRLSVHHIIHFETLLRINNIKSLQDAIECDKLWMVENGITLCIECHKLKHNQEGYRR